MDCKQNCAKCEVKNCIRGRLGMPCPECKGRSKMVTSRPAKRTDGEPIGYQRRRRRCVECGHRWNTCEIYAKDYKTIKKAERNMKVAVKMSINEFESFQAYHKKAEHKKSEAEEDLAELREEFRYICKELLRSGRCDFSEEFKQELLLKLRDKAKRWLDTNGLPF